MEDIRRIQKDAISKYSKDAFRKVVSGIALPHNAPIYVYTNSDLVADIWMQRKLELDIQKKQASAIPTKNKVVFDLDKCTITIVRLTEFGANKESEFPFKTSKLAKTAEEKKRKALDQDAHLYCSFEGLTPAQTLLSFDFLFRAGYSDRIVRAEWISMGGNYDSLKKVCPYQVHVTDALATIQLSERTLLSDELLYKDDHLIKILYGLHIDKLSPIEVKARIDDILLTLAPHIDRQVASKPTNKAAELERLQKNLHLYRTVLTYLTYSPTRQQIDVEKMVRESAIRFFTVYCDEHPDDLSSLMIQQKQNAPFLFATRMYNEFYSYENLATLDPVRFFYLDTPFFNDYVLFSWNMIGSGLTSVVQKARDARDRLLASSRIGSVQLFPKPLFNNVIEQQMIKANTKLNFFLHPSVVYTDADYLALLTELLECPFYKEVPYVSESGQDMLREKFKGVEGMMTQAERDQAKSETSDGREGEPRLFLLYQYALYYYRVLKKSAGAADLVVYQKQVQEFLQTEPIEDSVLSFPSYNLLLECLLEWIILYMDCATSKSGTVSVTKACTDLREYIGVQLTNNKGNGGLFSFMTVPFIRALLKANDHVITPVQAVELIYELSHWIYLYDSDNDKDKALLFTFMHQFAGRKNLIVPVTERRMDIEVVEDIAPVLREQRRLRNLPNRQPLTESMRTIEQYYLSRGIHDKTEFRKRLNQLNVLDARLQKSPAPAFVLELKEEKEDKEHEERTYRHMTDELSVFGRTPTVEKRLCLFLEGHILPQTKVAVQSLLKSMNRYDTFHLMCTYSVAYKMENEYLPILSSFQKKWLDELFDHRDFLVVNDIPLEKETAAFFETLYSFTFQVKADAGWMDSTASYVQHLLVPHRNTYHAFLTYQPDKIAVIEELYQSAPARDKFFLLCLVSYTKRGIKEVIPLLPRLLAEIDLLNIYYETYINMDQNIFNDNIDMKRGKPFETLLTALYQDNMTSDYESLRESVIGFLNEVKENQKQIDINQEDLGRAVNFLLSELKM